LISPNKQEAKLSL